MSERDEDLRTIFRTVAEGAKQSPAGEDKLLVAARRRRFMTAGAATLSLLLLIGGIAGASVFLGDSDPIEPAPGPVETIGCESVGYDLAVFVPEGATQSEVSELGEALEGHEAVVSLEFVTSEEAEQEFRAENPDHEGPLSTTERRDQYRLDLAPGIDTQDGGPLVRELANMGGGASAPGLECPEEHPERTFARYFFQAVKQDMSASGVVEVNPEEGTICLEASFSDNIVAAHLIDQHELDAPVITFFDPGEKPEGAFKPGPGANCIRTEDLEVLQLVVDDPQRFAVDFHRGPNDDPGLVAELVTQGEVAACSNGPRITEIPRRPVPTGERVPFAGECFQGSTDDDVPVFLTATLGADLRPVPKGRFGAGETCDLVAKTHSRLAISDGRLIGWFVPPEEGTCRSDSETRQVPLRPGTYSVAVGCPACEHAVIRLDPVFVPLDLHSVEDAVAYLANRLDVDVALPSELPRDIRLAPGRGRAVTVDREGRPVSGRLTLTYGNQGILIFDFGAAGFDGCGGDGAIEVDIAGQPGLMLTKPYPWTQIIWPAEPGDDEATYGIYGSLRAEAMLEVARSMQIAVSETVEKSEGCL